MHAYIKNIFKDNNSWKGLYRLSKNFNKIENHLKVKKHQNEI